MDVQSILVGQTKKKLQMVRCQKKDYLCKISKNRF